MTGHGKRDTGCGCISQVAIRIRNLVQSVESEPAFLSGTVVKGQLYRIEDFAW